MNTMKHYLLRIRRNVFHKSEAYALEGGITFGPGSDPKGSFNGSPKLAIYWYQPNSALPMEEAGLEKRSLRGLMSKMGMLRKTA